MTFIIVVAGEIKGEQNLRFIATRFVVYIPFLKKSIEELCFAFYITENIKLPGNIYTFKIASLHQPPAHSAGILTTM